MEQELKKQLDEQIEAVKVVTETLSKQKDHLDVLENEKIDKAIADIADMSEKLQKSENINEELKTRIETAEQIASESKKDVEEVIITKEEFDEYGQYLRKGIPLSDETHEKVARLVIYEKASGISNAEKEILVKAEVTNTKAYIAGSNPAGGYSILPNILSDVSNIQFETSPIRPYARVVGSEKGDPVQVMLLDGQADSGWVGELDLRPAHDTPSMGMIDIPLHEQYSLTPATPKMLQNSFLPMGSIILEDMNDKIIRTENTAFVVGDSSQKPTGFLSYSAWAVAGTYERDAIEQITGTDSTAGFNGDDLIDLQGALKSDYDAKAIFACNRDGYTRAMKLKDSNGNYLFNFRMLLEGGVREFLGKAVVIMNDIPVVSTGSLSFVYGDFSKGYTIADGMGFRLIRDEVTDKRYIQFYTTKFTGGAVTNFEAIKILKMGTVS